MSAFSEKSFEKILDDMCKRVTECSTMEGSFIYTALAPFAMELAELYMKLDSIENNGFADSADFEHLKKIAGDRGLTPNVATHAEGIGKFDKEVPTGSKFSLNTINWISGERLTGALDGYFYYKMVSEQVGSSCNKQIGTLTPITFIEGLTFSKLTEITIPAVDDESVEDFRQRYYDSFNKKSFGGNKADYIEKINSFSGVGGCKVYPLWNGGGSVKIVVINSSYEKPTSALISYIQAEIDPKEDGMGDGYAPIGHNVTIKAVDNFSLTVSVKLVLDEQHEFEDVVESIKQAVNTYLTTLKKTWDVNEFITIRVAQVMNAILNVKGVLDITECLLNNQTGNIELDKDAIPVLQNVEEIEDGVS